MTVSRRGLIRCASRAALSWVGTGGDCVSSGRTVRRHRTTLRSWTTTDDKEERRMFMRAVHPGEVLKGELEELGITPTEFARRSTCRPTALARSSPASVRSPATPRYASVTGSAAILSSGSTFRPSTTWFRPTGRPAPRSVIFRRGPAFREREPLRGSHDQRGAGMRLGGNRPVLRIERSRLQTARRVSERV